MRGYRLIKEHNEKRRECPHCKTVKPFIFKMWCGRSRVYMDEKGRNWAGSWCPDCHAAKYGAGTGYATRRNRLRKLKQAEAITDADLELL